MRPAGCYDPDDPATLDLPLPPWWWYMFAKHPKRWIYMVTTWVLLALEYAGQLPGVLHVPLLIAVWAYIPYQVQDIFYQHRVSKERSKRRAQRHEARMRMYARKAKQIYTPDAYLPDGFERMIELYEEAAEEGHGVDWLRQRAGEIDQ